MRLCNYCQAGMGVLPTLEIGKYIFCGEECAEGRLDELERQLRRIIASADECDVPTGAGVPLVSIDARLIEEAREVLK